MPGDKKNTDAMNAMMKARIAYANEFGNLGAKRMVSPIDNPYQFENGYTGTHYMGSYDNYAIPNIQDVNGNLEMTGPRMNEAIKFDRPQDAEYFAENYKNVSPVFQNKYPTGGILDGINVGKVNRKPIKQLSLQQRMMQDAIARQEQIAQQVPVSENTKPKETFVARGVDEELQHQATQRLTNSEKFYSDVTDDKKRNKLIADAEQEYDKMKQNAAFEEFKKTNDSTNPLFWENWERHQSGMDKNPALGGVHPEAWLIGGMGAGQLLKGAGILILQQMH
jgi:hypothetical protein